MLYSTEEVREVYEETDSKEDRLDVFFDGVIGNFPLDRDIRAIVEGELTHPAGIGSVLDVEESAQVKAEEFADEEVFPHVDELDDDIRDKFLAERSFFISYISNKYYDKLKDTVEDVYKACLQEYSTTDSNSISTLIEGVEEDPTVSGINTVLDSVMDEY